MDSIAAGITGAEVASPETQQAIRDCADQLLQQAQSRTTQSEPCPVDRRIEQYLNTCFADLVGSDSLRLPPAIGLPRYGVSREFSLPASEDTYRNEYVTSYRVKNGVLHNPRSDRRTTKGTFHVTEGGLPIPGDKKSVPRSVFVELFRHALRPSPELLIVPRTASQPTPVKSFVSLLLRPIVCPEVPGVELEQRMEVRFFVPGGLVSNLDFVESIFGNAGDPALPENDAGLDVEHWTGHTGCVILAPQLTQLRKQALGLPKWDDATPRQQRDGMCWRDPAELYNEGQAFKLTCRNSSGVIVTLIADNYFGYCKKEVKTQISFAANLLGNVEEEHAGGALAFARYNLGYDFDAADYATSNRTLADVARSDDTIDLRPEGYGLDRHCESLVYVPLDARADLKRLQIWWSQSGKESSLPLRPGTTYMTPSGYQVQLEKHPATGTWRLIGTAGEGLFCHKPCTVSGGGKSEISKKLGDYIQYGPIFVANIDQDFNLVQKLFDFDYSRRWKAEHKPDYTKRPTRPLLSERRSLGSVIQLLTPSQDYTDEYNAWLHSFPDHIFPLVYLVKRYAPRDLAGNFREIFSVDSIDGQPGHVIRGLGRRIVGGYLRVGLLPSKAWRTFKLRQDFVPAVKVQMEDDITASAVVPRKRLGTSANDSNALSDKFSVNCEYRLFQRPDDAIHRGLDKQTELDMSRPDNFLSNYEPLTPEIVQSLVDRITEFDEFTPPLRDLLSSAAGASTVVCPAYPRVVDGKPSKNPRYLQIRPDLMAPTIRYIAERGMRLSRGISSSEPLLEPVGAVLIGRRNNPPDKAAGIRPLAVYNPIHYQELPEFFMDVICSLTGKSPSTTGAGSEGALTKGPFNALRTIVDLNAALVSYILTGLPGFSTAAGYVGPDKRVDHDISLLVPEIWCRLSPRERDPDYLIREGHLERIDDFEHRGKKIPASRLGYRITSKFVRAYFARIFDHPDRVFDEAYLRPETQDLDAFVDGINNITEAQQRVAEQAFSDGSIEDACPPLRALLSIMAQGTFEGKDVHHPDVRSLFTRQSLESSDWYLQRLSAKQQGDERLWRRHADYLDNWLKQNSTGEKNLVSIIRQRRAHADQKLKQITALSYQQELFGTLGVDPSLYLSRSRSAIP